MVFLPKTGYSIRPIEQSDRDWVLRFIEEHWGGSRVVVHGVTYIPHELSGYVAMRGEECIGLITYHLEGSGCEIVTLNSVLKNIGAGTALVDAVKSAALRENCTRLWLITTNDNLNALRFYQKRGFRIVRVHPDAVTRAREMKPEIPLTGDHGIPIRDEIELEMMLGLPE